MSSAEGIETYFEAYATYEHAPTAPQYAKVLMTNDLVEKVRDLQRLCVERDLSEMHVRAAPLWGPEGIEDEVSLVNPTLVVTPWSVWFEEALKHSGYSFKTRLVAIEHLLAEHEDATPGRAVMHCEPEVLEDA